MGGFGRTIPLNDPPAWDQLDHFRINRKLEKLAKQYADEDRAKPTPVERVASLERFLDQIEGVYDQEIDSGTVADTPELWAAIYRHKILVTTLPRINVLAFDFAHKLHLAGGGKPQQQAAAAAAGRMLRRLRTKLLAREAELARACEQSKRSSTAQRPHQLAVAERSQLGDNPKQTTHSDEGEPYESKSKRRALLVAKVIEELMMLRTEPRFELEEDFAPMRKKYKSKRFYVFDAARKFPNLRDTILTVKSKFQRGRPIGLAQQIVGNCEGVGMDSIKKDWLHFKPQQYRQSGKHKKP